ncbi:MAG: PAS domain S-box protein, partial [Rubrivivax sp.]|nr:PAS domain S-box protein [Rubrivivax sp.]
MDVSSAGGRVWQNLLALRIDRRRLTLVALGAATLLSLVSMLQPLLVALGQLVPPELDPAVRLRRAAGVTCFLLAFAVTTLLYARRLDRAAAWMPLFMSLALALMFNPQAFARATIPQAFWVPFVCALVLSGWDIVLLTAVASVATVVLAYPGAFAHPVAVTGSLTLAVLLAAGRLTQEALRREAQSARDEARAAEQARSGAESHLRAMFEAMGDALVFSDLERRIVQVNPAFERLFGWRAADVIGRSTELIYAEHTDFVTQGQRRYGAGAAGDEGLYEMRYRRRDGSVFWGESSGHRILGPDGAVQAIFGVHRDITARKQLEQSQRRSMAQLAGFVREAPNTMAMFDRDLRYLAASAHWLQAYGRGATDLTGVDHRAFYPDHPEAWLAVYRRALAGEPVRKEEDMWCDPEGVEHFLRWAVFPWRDADGVIGGLIMEADDITPVVQARRALESHQTDLEEQVAHRTAAIAQMQEELARRASEAEAANRAKSAFLANMSHEIRTPMNAILGFSHLVARDTRDAVQRERLQKVDDAGRHLLQVINDILDLSKIEAGKMVLEEAEFALDELLARSFDMVGTRARDKGLELIVDTDGLPARMRGDSTRLSQALINLLSNAVKFTERGWVRLRGELLREAGSGVLVRFEVTDTGAGIAPERLSRIFEAFEQGDASISRQHGGTGLGLALTRHIAAMLEGEVGATST